MCITFIVSWEATSRKNNNNMKMLIALILVCVATSLVQGELNLTDEQKAKLISHHEECSGQVSVEDDDLEKLLDGDFPDKKTFKDYLLCLSKRIGFQDEDGKVQKDLIVSKIKDSIEDPSKAEEYVEKCLVKDDDPAEVVYKVVKCLQENTPKLVLAP